MMNVVNEVKRNKNLKVTIKIMKNNNQLYGSIEKNHKEIHSRIIVVGTGLHRQVLGHEDSPLSSWSKLLTSISEDYKTSIKGAITKDPVMLWEKMVLEISNRPRNQNLRMQAFNAELMLKREVCDLLKCHSCKSSNIEIFKRNIICDMMFKRATHLLSLNFDKLIYNHVKTKKISVNNGGVIQDAKNKGIRNKDAKLLYDRTKCLKNDQESIVWHPHGHVDRPESLVMGMRDYGFLPPSYFYAFKQFKKWERKTSGDSHGLEKYQKLLQALASFDEKTESSGITDPADHWVTRFMLYPLTFVGVGLSQVEIGMRWLLVQRARNLRNVPDDQKPATEFFGPTNPEIPGLTWIETDMKGAFDQMWESALGS
jgi:hypothetical protein